MRYLALSLATLTGALAVIGSSPVGIAQQPVAGFTPAQAQQGSVVYKESCAQCHGANLDGGGAPALTGPTFQGEWRSRGVDELVREIAGTMPPGSPGSLSPQATVGVTAYILQRNGAATGPRELAANATSPISEVLVAKPALSAPPVLGEVVEGRYGPGGPREILTIGEGPFASLWIPPRSCASRRCASRSRR
jgi:mono/diheme cytochrome c family protein